MIDQTTFSCWLMFFAIFYGFVAGLFFHKYSQIPENYPYPDNYGGAVLASLFWGIWLPIVFIFKRAIVPVAKAIIRFSELSISTYEVIELHRQQRKIPPIIEKTPNGHTTYHPGNS